MKYRKMKIWYNNFFSTSVCVGGTMASRLVRSTCVVLCSWARHSHIASLHRGTGEFNAGGNPEMDLHPIQELHATETGIK